MGSHLGIQIDCSVPRVVGENNSVAKPSNQHADKKHPLPAVIGCPAKGQLGPLKADELPSDSRVLEEDPFEDFTVGHLTVACTTCRRPCMGRVPPVGAAPRVCSGCKKDACDGCLDTLDWIFCSADLPQTPKRPRKGRPRVQPPPLDLSDTSNPASPSKLGNAPRAEAGSGEGIDVGAIIAELSRTHSGRKESLGMAARMMAALAVAQKHWPRWKMMALFYRLTEFCASVLCLCCSLWLVWHWAMFVLALLLWYLPAALRTRSLWKPLRLPLLNFVVDDFSLLGLHPTPRPAVRMYAVGVLRVLILLIVVPYLGASIVMPDWLKHAFSNENSIKLLFQGQRLHGRRIPVESVEEWAAVSITVLTLSAVWVGLTLPMLLAAVCRASGPLSWQKNTALLRDIDNLAEEIESANCHSDWRACLLSMKQLQQDHPSLKLTTLGTTVGPAAGTVVHLVLDVVASYTFFSHGHSNPSSQVPDFILGFLTVINFLFTLMHNCNAGKGNPFAMCWEAKASFERGIFTDTFINILYGDQGAHVLLTLAVNVFGIPFRADDPFKVASAILAILITVATCVPFIFQQFDLGVERVGLEHGEGSQPQGLRPKLPKRPPEEEAAIA